MELYLKNIGKLKEVNIKLNGITVIAGENDTGKSTVGKALFSVFNSFYKVDENIRAQKFEAIYNYTTDSLEEYEFLNNVSASDMLSFIDDILDKSILNKQDIRNIFIERFNQSIYEEDLQKLFDIITEIINVSDEQFIKDILNSKIDREFNRQVCNVFSDDSSTIKLKLKDEEMKINLVDNDVDYVSNPFNFKTEIVYFDTPYVLDELNQVLSAKPSYYFNIRKDHKYDLMRKLYNESKNNTIETILVKNKLDDIYAKLDEVCSGDLVGTDRGKGYRKAGSDKVIDVRNLSTGLKTFVILKTLLLNGSIGEKGVLILDEPEIHLHPQWQLVFAKLIVLLQKQFNMHILLTTHSPYFLNAIEVYTEKYNTAKDCNYYLAYNDGEMANIDEVTDNLELIYARLARPLQDLENKKYEEM